MIPFLFAGVIGLVVVLSFKDSIRDITGSISNLTKSDTQKEREGLETAAAKRGFFNNVYFGLFGEAAYLETQGKAIATPAEPQTGEKKQTADQNRYNRYSRRSPKYKELKNG